MNKYQYGTCTVCGREHTRIYRLYGYVVCSKHMHQIIKYGAPQDSNPRTVHDLNDFVFRLDGYVEMNLYNQKCVCVGKTIIDPDVVDMIKYKKWSLSSYGYVYHNYPHTDLHRLIMGVTNNPNVDVDHINGNTLDNRRCNLRVCSTSENTANKHFSSMNTSGYIGVHPSRGGWSPEIRFNHIRAHLGRYNTLEEAVYARLCAVKICFGEYANHEQVKKAEDLCKDMNANRKVEIERYVIDKIHKHFGSQLCRSPRHAAQHSCCAGSHSSHLRPHYVRRIEHQVRLLL